MRSGPKGSIYRRLVLIALAIVVVGLIAVPAALADSMAVGGLVQGHYYGGARVMAATVTVPDPAAPSGPALATAQADAAGLFVAFVDPLPAPTYSSLTATAIAFGPHNNVPDWSDLFRATTGSASFENSAGTAASVKLNLVVKNTRVVGTVSNAATRKPLRHVKVTIVGGKARTTSKTGKFSAVRALWPVTSYRIKFSKKGFFSVTKRFPSQPGSKVVVNVVLKKKV